MLALFGVLRGVGGQLSVHGKPVAHMSPGRAKSPALGLALIPEDRKTEGLILPMSIAENLSMAALSRLSAAGWVNRGAESTGVAGAIAKLRIKIGAAADAVATLSGGNQQKVVIGKWLMTNARVILLNDPTRGIDVGTKQEIYVLLRELAAEGVAVLLYSTDYEELIGLCDRVLIMYGGAITRVLEAEHITETNIVAAALNLAPGDKLAA